MRTSWLIGGAQGTGVDTSAQIFGDAMASMGYYVYGNREYYSNIKGRHSYFNVTISDKRVNSVSQMIDVMATFDAETIFQHFEEAKGVLIYNTSVKSTKASAVVSMEPEVAQKVESRLKEKGLGETVEDVVKFVSERGVKTIEIDYDGIMKEISTKLHLPLSVIERVKNTIAIGASGKVLGVDKAFLLNSIKKTFKQETFYTMNSAAIDLVYDKVDKLYDLTSLKNGKKRVQIDGNTAVALGKIYAGVRFQSYYPITPASDESVYLEAHQEVMMKDPKTGDKRKGTVVVVQSEDELAAINMAIGASLTGVRAATATSGPGFSLMAEGIGWAGMNEAAVVITYYIRGGPSTGQPTRSSQADLLFALNVGHGEFPRIVIASGDHVEAFRDAVWAFNLAERYQTPVIHLVDKGLANAYSIFDEDELDLNSLKIERGKLVCCPAEGYKRFEITKDGISPRVPLGEALMMYSGDEHDEEGHIREESENRIRMYEKRMRKLETADAEIPEEERIKTYGDMDSENVILTWGSPKGTVLDAIEELKKEGISLGVVQVRMFSPYPKKIMSKLLSGKRIIDIENNYLAQSNEVLKLNTGISADSFILKWNGRPIMMDEVINALKLSLKGEKKVILNAGA
ncbi:2-oxoacid:ferredoxin oxidoreductase subunit alpha [Sulfuracidifex metallicus]|uniref:2-oxoacid oxidoreductase (ferredoxin) n=1 Tax=Sulfuracidifex metallicus DSM 6482 = JCM 9184 TaxID=523847 RepID=A0A6A9QIL6_SULME|nr:2-oxoacid:ferredoxin oxidoreductase subunit alpha [Sulfuracidifex metallicus]MUN28826.1 2-oxoacid:acceptor oxidoreductase subunit alpha [Sulfuracidifex metallicus DSM 6482 = JCM 9184]WOE50661.1 2-oxoacid:ferredoxin oxidoreductase subunit alpha [Sulfuracidifex metallicus DSM 6482 = JCM 9184]